ncbi:hypothetical protein B0T19DRAFT_158285 [Cercophora scortea]|uniref:GAR domain-containing protein n=1 Tax=Cercophora scortea TaxID=314031 RepID=A0AAE0ILD8_9PEZI|nr:hypothetical protein B0T19DRAFT_158285 [Cercophora scortea]
MIDPPSLSQAQAHLAPRGRQPRPTPDSPIRQHDTDDLLNNLTPRSAVEAFRNPSGALKACMDAATPAEQAFALRAAVASKNIQEWLDELSEWPWPSGSGSAGFEAPAAKGITRPRSDTGLSSPEHPQHEEPPPIDDMYLGSLLVSEVAEFESRIEEIGQSMEELDVEEIKTQVLQNHIMPLSRPGSPMPASGRSVYHSSLSTYATMDDLTALVTATVIQALPNLSKLTRLMSSWNLRLAVLRKIPVFLASLVDGEVALQSGWNAINAGEKIDHDDINPNGSSTARSSTLSRNDFDVMRTILEQNVAKAGRDLDRMLDVLEGWEETLPEHWIDRMDALERGYGEWVVACEKKIRESDWAIIMRETIAPPVFSPIPRPQGQQESEEEVTPGATNLADAEISIEPASPTAGREASASSPGPQGDLLEVERGSSKRSAVNASSGSKDDPPPRIEIHLPSEDEDEPRKRAQTIVSLETRLEEHEIGQAREGSRTRDERTPGAFDGSEADVVEIVRDPAERLEKGARETLGQSDAIQRKRQQQQQQQLLLSERGRRDSQSDLDDLDFDISEVDVPQPELLKMPGSRRASNDSSSSTVVHGPLSGFLDFSSDPPDHGTPEMPRLGNIDFGEIPSDDLSPPSSPEYMSSIRSRSVSFNDMPTVAEIPDDEDSPTTPSKSSFMLEDDSPRSNGTPSKTTASGNDDQLQQQISEILETLPAKIRLTSEPYAVNLNPPDFAMPIRKQPKQDHTLRSHSSLSTVSNISSSSRAGTPSFTLAPAFGRNSRSRHQQRGGNAEIKLYHLSRSNGEAPIKLFIRCVGENGERVMVRVGGGWADLGEYLKEYASHHGRRSGVDGKVEVKDLPRVQASRSGSTPPRPASAQDSYAPLSPLQVRKSRKTAVEELSGSMQPRSPLIAAFKPETPPSGASARSRSSSRLSWAEEDSSLGMAGPRAKHIEMSEESKAWVESVKEKVRIASSDHKLADPAAAAVLADGKFGEMGKVGATKRLFRRQV